MPYRYETIQDQENFFGDFCADLRLRKWIIDAHCRSQLLERFPTFS
jgi:hypothetical protein